MIEDFPSIIHQTWKSRDLPFFVAECHRRVKAMNPDWNHRFYTDEDMLAVVAAAAEAGGPRFLSANEFQNIPSGIEKSDVFRCAALYLNGGIYCDLDMEFLRPATELIASACSLSPVHAHADLFLTIDHPIHCERLHRAKPLMNHFMIARPRARFLKKYLEAAARWVRDGTFIEGQDPVQTTGPGLMSRIFEAQSSPGMPTPAGVALIPWEWIHPLPDMAWDFPEMKPYDQMIRDFTWRKKVNSFTVHYWWHSYCGANSIFDIYGERIFHRGD